MNFGETIFQNAFPGAEYMGDMRCGFDFIFNDNYYEVKGISNQTNQYFKLTEYQRKFLQKHGGYLAVVNLNHATAILVSVKINDIRRLLYRHKIHYNEKPGSNCRFVNWNIFIRHIERKKIKHEYIHMDYDGAGPPMFGGK